MDSAAAESPLESPVEAEPPAVAAVFGDRLPLARRYAGLLVGDGVVRGVIGPREAQRIWSRHLLNCAAVGELFGRGERVVDVGSGAGLPGIALALCRPDLRIDLVEPLQRRVDFLDDTVAALGLADQVRVVRGRADDAAVVVAVGGAPWVTARAVAPLDRLVRWCLPLLAPSGRFAFLKGASAEDEVQRHRPALRRVGVQQIRVVHCGVGLVEPGVTVVTAEVSKTRRGCR